MQGLFFFCDTTIAHSPSNMNRALSSGTARALYGHCTGTVRALPVQWQAAFKNSSASQPQAATDPNYCYAAMLLCCHAACMLLGCYSAMLLCGSVAVELLCCALRGSYVAMLSVRPSVCPSVPPSVRPSVPPSLHPSVRSSVRASLRPSFPPSARPSVPTKARNPDRCTTKKTVTRQMVFRQHRPNQIRPAQSGRRCRPPSPSQNQC